MKPAYVQSHYSATAHKHGEQGITMIMVLIFIVSLSLIAAAGMRNVSTGERVIANERDRMIAFQGAESAGREAVGRITAGTETSLTSGYYAAPLSQGGNASFWRTTSNLAADTSCAGTDTTKRFNWASCSSAAAGAYGNSEAPRYAIEKMPDIVISGSVTERWFRVTARASGGSNEADVILQLMVLGP